MTRFAQVGGRGNFDGVIATQVKRNFLPEKDMLPVFNWEMQTKPEAIESCGLLGARRVPVERFGGPPETRTPDPLIKSQLLYQLS